MPRDLSRRLAALRKRLPPVPPPRAAADRDVLYRRLEAVGLARWDERKQYWSPTDPRLLRALLAERKRMGVAGDGR